MKKYWTIFKLGIQNSVVYRMDTFLMFFSQIISLIFLIYLWLSIYNQGGVIGDYSLASLISYYVLTGFLAFTVGTQFVSWMTSDIIMNGEVSNYLLKPFNFLGDIFFTVLGGMVYKIPFYLIIVLTFLYFFPFSFDFRVIFYFVISIIISILISFLIFYSVGLSSFYLESNFGINALFSWIAQLFSGMFIPLDILPEFFLKLADFLPFKFLAFVPVSVINGRISPEDFYIYAIEGLIWIIMLFYLSQILWKRGIIKYESYGG